MEPTRISFDGTKIIVSPNLREIFSFLIEIDKEVQSFLGRESQLKKIRNQFLEYTKLIQSMGEIIKEANLDFHFPMYEHPATIVDKLKFNPHPRSEMIVLFSYLETLRCLWTSYDLNTDNERKIRDASDEKLESFYKKFCLSPENKWVKANSKVSGKISAEKLRKLRNALTHFFSTSGLGITPERMKADSEKFSKLTNNKVLFISTRDLYEICAGAFVLLMQKWFDDCQESLHEQKPEFQERIKCVHSIVKKYGAVICRTNNQ